MLAEYDIAVVGAGILGLATARALSGRFPNKSLVVLEKESKVALHQSGRNSGVIHSGLYYRPESLKAQLCVAGSKAMVRFCQEHGIPFTQRGKVVVATSDEELPALIELERRGIANGLRGLRRIGPDELRELEPHAAGVAGLHVPSTGVVDFGDVARVLAQGLIERPVTIITSFRVDSVVGDSAGFALHSPLGALRASGVINCGGLYSDHIARMFGIEPKVRIVPFRGEYYNMSGASADLVRSSIYPVPDARLPFLGVHLTRGAAGAVQAGPNAVLAGAREGYNWRTIHPRELWEAITYPGLLRLGARHWRSGATEIARSLSRRRFVASVRRLLPDVDPRDFARGSSGVRAQALTRSGELYDDFLIQVGPRSVHVLNAPSPAATSALMIGEHLAQQAGRVLDLL
jgi:L-2-hydroxyglutarate oxidase